MAAEEHRGEKRTYARYTRRKVLFILGCLAVMIVAVGTSVTVGGRELSIAQVYEVIFRHLSGAVYTAGSAGWMDDHIVWDVRLPRALFAVVAGAGLALGGAAMQSVLRNPLADPYITGVSSGACLGVAVAAVLGFQVMNGGAGEGAVVNAFVFALVPMLMIILLAPAGRTSPATLILAGVAISYLFNALSTIVLTFTDSETLATIYAWQIGSLSDITWACLPVPVATTALGSAALLLCSRQLNILSLGDAQASALGLNPERLRTLMLVLTALIVASVVAYAGIIGFIGLVSPHIVRMLIDSDNRFVVPAAALFGAAFLLLCDVLTRAISNVEAVPVGVVVSFIGAPIFLYLIIRQSKTMW